MGSATMEAHKAAVRRLFDETNKGNLEFMDELLSPDFKSIGGAGFQDLEGPAAFKELTLTFMRSFPDLHFKIEEIIAEGDDVLTWGTLSGTHKGDFYGIPPTGHRVSWTGCVILRFRGDQIFARYQEFDAMGLMAQMQPPAAPAASA